MFWKCILIHTYIYIVLKQRYLFLIEWLFNDLGDNFKARNGCVLVAKAVINGLLLKHDLN